MSDLWSDRLSEYLDGELDAAGHAAIETHLADCADCARDLEALREVAARTRTLEDLPPAGDLWPAIRSRIATAPAPRRVLALPRFELPRQFRFTLPQALAAGFALMLISGGSVWWALRHDAFTPGVSRGPASGATATTNHATAPGLANGPAYTPDTGTSAATAGLSNPVGTAGGGYDVNYDQAILELERTLAMHRTELDTSTVRIVEQNLAIIDRAIVQARRALAADPASPYLNQHLALQMKLKLDLLRRTTALAAAQG